MKHKIYLIVLLVGVILITSCASKIQPAGEIPTAEKEQSAPETQAAPESSDEASSAPVEDLEQQAPTIPTPTATPLPPAPTLIDGKTLQERLAEAYERLHTRGSAEHIRKSFPDIELVYTDDAVGISFPREIIPFRYYYSREADTTFNICAVELTVFICKGKLDHLIRGGDVDSGRCEMTPIYGDPRL